MFTNFSVDKNAEDFKFPYASSSRLVVRVQV